MGVPPLVTYKAVPSERLNAGVDSKQLMLCKDDSNHASFALGILPHFSKNFHLQWGEENLGLISQSCQSSKFEANDTVSSQYDAKTSLPYSQQSSLCTWAHEKSVILLLWQQQLFQTLMMRLQMHLMVKDSLRRGAAQRSSSRGWWKSLPCNALRCIWMAICRCECLFLATCPRDGQVSGASFAAIMRLSDPGLSCHVFTCCWVRQTSFIDWL